MKLKKAKKGFTLVELVVVIAIIAVLSTVSVVSYLGFTKKAKVSNDVSLTSQMNNVLMANEAVDGKATTAHEAVEQLVEGGIDVTKLTPTANDYNYVWDSTQNKIFLLDESKKVVSPTNYTIAKDKKNLFAFVGKESEINKFKDDNEDVYSYYLKANFDASSLVVATGLDVGSNNVNVTYQTESVDAVTIRTNGGTLTVNAKNGTVDHYGSAMNVKVEAIKGESYHEYGKVSGTLALESGHVQVENGAEIASVIASKSEDTTLPTSRLTTTSGSTVGTVVINDSSVEVKVDNGSNVTEVAPGEGVTIDSSKVTGITPSSTTIDTSISSNFAGGLGTETSPYLIDALDQWKYLASQSLSRTGLGASGKYFSVLTDLDFENVNEYVQLAYFAGKIDFNNHSVVNFEENSKQGFMDYGVYAFLFYELTGNTTIENLVFTTSSSGVDKGARLIGHINQVDSQNEDGTDYSILINNVTINGMGNYSDNNVGLFVYFVGKSNLTLSNCKNYANIYNSSLFTGVFIGRTYNANSTYGESYCKNISFINCYNYGTVVNTQVNQHASILVSNGSGLENVNLTAVNCYNYGTIIASNIDLVGFSKKQHENASVINNGIISTSTGVPLKVSDGKFTFDAVNGAVKYNMVFSFASAAIGGGTTSVVFDLTPDQINTVDALSWIDEEEVSSKEIVSTKQYGTTVYTYNGKYVLVGNDIKLRHQPSVTVMAYDENDQIIGVYFTYSY